MSYPQRAFQTPSGNYEDLLWTQFIFNSEGIGIKSHQT